MLICGVKYTHDAGVTLIEYNGGVAKLIFSVELEKLHNNQRHCKVAARIQINDIFIRLGYETNDIDKWVVDGWDGEWINDLNLPVAGYMEHEFDRDIDQRYLFRDRLHAVAGVTHDYQSFCHVHGHALGAYVMSGWGKIDKRYNHHSYSVVWDGGTSPRVYGVAPGNEKSFYFRGSLLWPTAHIYGIMGYYWGPYKNNEIRNSEPNPCLTERLHGGMSNAGKLMAYIGQGKHFQSLSDIAHLAYEITEAEMKQDKIDFDAYRGKTLGVYEHNFCRHVMSMVSDNLTEWTDADILLAIHDMLGQKLLYAMKHAIPYGRKVCLSGGAFLNIKWNSKIRDSGYFKQMFVPPNANDSGSSMGAACAYLALEQNCWNVKWNVYSGQHVHAAKPSNDRWKKIKESGGQKTDTVSAMAKTIAEILAKDKGRHAIIMLHGMAEMGPRALGNRSILMHPGYEQNKIFLNSAKKREHFRPVAPICMQEWADQYFNPGTPDPYMLYDHRVKKQWANTIPAVTHIDGTARLQTVTLKQNKLIYLILKEFLTQTSLPMLCNTSANLLGRGFFDDFNTASEWAEEVGINYVFCNGVLYERQK